MSFMVGGGGGSGGGSGFGGGGGDETFLEAFVESVSTLPHEVKRNLELLKDLDARCGEGTERMLRLQNEYLEDAEGKMMELEVVVKERWRHQATDRQPEDHLSPSQEKGESAITEPDDSYFVGIRVLGGTRNSSSDGDRPGEVVIPTTMELEQYVYHQQQQQRGERSSTPQPALYEEILELQRDMQQMADEKVAVARQLYDRLDGTVRRLDHDLAEMERLLQVRVVLLFVSALSYENEQCVCGVATVSFCLTRFRNVFYFDRLPGRFVVPGVGRLFIIGGSLLLVAIRTPWCCCGQAQRLGGVPNHARFGRVDLGQSVAARPVHRDVPCCRRGRGKQQEYVTWWNVSPRANPRHNNPGVVCVIYHSVIMCEYGQVQANSPSCYIVPPPLTYSCCWLFSFFFFFYCCSRART
jgi:hypothetical protein